VAIWLALRFAMLCPCGRVVLVRLAGPFGLIAPIGHLISITVTLHLTRRFSASQFPQFLQAEIAACKLLRLARKRNLATRVRQNNPTGKSPQTLSSPSRKNI
jgi:hypothetical protein